MYIKHSIIDESLINLDILSRSFHGVIFIDQQSFEIVYMNRAIEEIFGYDTHTFITTGISILSENISENVQINHMNEVVKGNEINYITKVKGANNKILYIEAKYFLTNNNKKYICGLFKDITEKVLYAKEQNYKKSRLNRFLSTLHKVSHSLEFQKGDIQTSSNLITKLLSEAIDVDRVSIRLYSEDHTELVSLSLYDKKLNQYLEGKQLTRFMYAEFFDYIENQPILMINDINNDSIAQKLVSDFFSKDGMIVSMLVTKIVLEGKVHGYIFFQSWNKIEWDRDAILFASQIADYVAILILNQKLRKEQELLEEKVKLRTQELEISVEKETRANLAKRRFLSHMSHELRTPLNTLIGYLDLIDKSNDIEENQRYIERMKQGAHDLVNIVDDILDFSKIESGKVIVSNQFIQLKSSILQVLNLYDNHLRKSEVKFEYFFDLSMDYYETDEKLIKQILHNLLSNAFKFTKTGLIQVNVTEMIHHGYQMKNVVFEVCDTGIGIYENDLSRIFQSFEQSINDSNNQHKGTGLGLSITKDLVHILGGTIEVESMYGKGSTFRASIPMKYQNQSILHQEQEIEAMPEVMEHLNILVVEDNQINLEILKITLEKARHQVDYALNGYEALQKISSIKYDLVLMDIHMPLLDGLDTTQLIRLNPNYESINIIALTANAFEFNENNYLKFGFNGFLVKPVKQNILFKTIYSVNNKHMTHPNELAVLNDIFVYFEKYAKMSIKEGFEYTGNNPSLYFDLIVEFLHTHKDTINKASILYREQKYENFYRDIHTLKGLTKLLGFTHVHQAILSLEDAYNDNHESYKILERFDQLIALFDCTCFCIQYIINAFEERGMPYGL